jgi:hypothetical protein
MKNPDEIKDKKKELECWIEYWMLLKKQLRDRVNEFR